MKFLVLDQGIFVEQASGLSDKGRHDVKYHSSWEKSEPCSSDFEPGINFEYLKKEKDLFKWIDWADCIVNFDVYENNIISFLREKYPNKSIFGSGKGEWLENSRWRVKKWIKEQGLPLQKSYLIKGVNRLRDFVKEKPNHYIKTDLFRSDCESFHAKNYKMVEGRLDGLMVKYGVMADDINFIAEEMLDTDVEIGFDGFFWGEDFVQECFMGYEKSKELILDKKFNISDLPKECKFWLDKMKSLLKSLDYRGAISIEWKCFKGTWYALDICARSMSPGGAGYPQWITNWPELVYKIGKKEKVSMKTDYRFISAIFLESKRSEEQDVFLDFKKENRDKIKLMSACQNKEGDYYAVKPCKTVAIPIGSGNTWQEAIESLKDSCELVDADDLDKGNVGQLDELKKIISNGEKIGISFS